MPQIRKFLACDYEMAMCISTVLTMLEVDLIGYNITDIDCYSAK